MDETLGTEPREEPQAPDVRSTKSLADLLPVIDSIGAGPELRGTGDERKQHSRALGESR